MLLALAAAIFIGKWRSAPDPAPLVETLFPLASSYEGTSGVYSALDEKSNLLGWIGTGESPGYGGPMRVALGIDERGKILQATLVEHRETPSFFPLVKAPDFLASLEGKAVEEIDRSLSSLDGVTGATRSAEALSSSVRHAAVRVASSKLAITLPEVVQPFEFGTLEITVIALFALGIAGSRFRWACQVAGLLVLGFWKNSPITFAKLSAFLSGYFPPLHTNLFLYLMIAGFVLNIVLLGRSVYCTHLCPFGAAQRILNVIGGRRVAVDPKLATRMNLARDLIVFIALLTALVAANPSLAGYEPFAVLFALTGTDLQYLLLVIVFFAALMIRRPWCHFLCPMRTFERVLLDLRRRFNRKAANSE